MIASLLKTVRPVASVARALRWEAILIDPIGALLAVLAYELLVYLRSTHVPGPRSGAASPGWYAISGTDSLH